MKKKLAAGIVLAFAASPALAADPIVYDPPPVAAPAVEFDWTGAYIGVQAGWAFGDIDSSLTVPAGSNINATATGLALLLGNNDFDTNGFTGGVQAGFNWQQGSFVFGVEGDVNYIDLSETNVRTGTFGGANGRTIDTIDADILATLRARLGVAHQNWMFYGTGGIAFSDAEYSRALEWSFADGCPLGTTGLNRCHVGSDKFNIGYTVGGGVEYAFNTRFSIKAEYLYTDFGKAEFTTRNVGVANQPLNHSAHFDFHTVRLGVNMRF